MDLPRQVARVPIATPAGEFDVHAFENGGSQVLLALVRGSIGDGRSLLARLHSECLTGDVLGSLRCDCGPQLRTALRRIAAEGRGVLVYATGHEGRGIGLTNKLLAYMLQDRGLDTVDANEALRFPADARDHRDTAGVLRALGVRSVRLLTNNPAKAGALRDAGIAVEAMLPIRSAAHVRNIGYLRTKRARFGHLAPNGDPLPDAGDGAIDVSGLIGGARPRNDRPAVILKYAQTLDGRIATATGDSRWITGEDERRVSHALRAACDAVLVGVGTAVRDDPQLTVRLVDGVSPIRVVLDPMLRIPLAARVLHDDAATVVLTGPTPDARKRRLLRRSGVAVRTVRTGPGGLDLHDALRSLREAGIASVLVEGGARVITSLLSACLVDRLIVGVAPIVIGSGTDAVGELGIRHVADRISLVNRSVHPVGPDVLIAGDVEQDQQGERSRAAAAGATVPNDPSA